MTAALKILDRQDELPREIHSINFIPSHRRSR